MRQLVSSSGLAAALLLTSCCARTRCQPCPTTPAAPPPATARAVAPNGAPAEATPELQILVEGTLLRVTAAQAERLLGAHLASLAEPTAVLSPVEARAVTAELQRGTELEVLQAPAVLVVAGNEASIFIGESYREDLRRPAGMDPYEAALADGSWSGCEIRMRPALLSAAPGLSLDLSFILRDAPPKDTTPDPDLLRRHQAHARAQFASLQSGETAILLAPRGPAGPAGGLVIFLFKPTILAASPVASTR